MSSIFITLLTEVVAQRANDPIQRHERRLLAERLLDDETLARHKAEVEEELAAAVQFGRESPLPEPEEALDDLYATPLYAPSAVLGRGGEREPAPLSRARGMMSAQPIFAPRSGGGRGLL